MKKLLLLIALFTTILAQAQLPFLDPSMTITGFGIIDSPFGEEVDKIIDGDINTKFLDFELGDGMGFTVDLGGISTAAIAIVLTTANDFPVRDPIDFEVLGSNDGTAFTSVATGTVPCITDRFEPREFAFANTTDYGYYRVNFSAPCDPSGGTGIPSIQLAEVQLLELELGVNSSEISQSEVTIYPNPSSGSFILDYAGSNVISEATLFDITGKMVTNLNLNDFLGSQEFSVNLTSGVYFLKVSSTTNTISKKIVVK